MHLYGSDAETSVVGIFARIFPFFGNDREPRFGPFNFAFYKFELNKARNSVKYVYAQQRKKRKLLVSFNFGRELICGKSVCSLERELFDLNHCTCTLHR